MPHKGVHLLLRAFRQLQDNNSELHLYGTASDDQYERLLKETAGDDPRIQWCGTYRAEQVGTVLQGIDVMIVPSLCYESYG